MSNYLSNIVRSNFGDKSAMFGTLVMDDGAATAVVTGFDNVDFVGINPRTAATTTPRYSLSGGSLTVVTAASGTSFDVMIVGR